MTARRIGVAIAATLLITGACGDDRTTAPETTNDPPTTTVAVTTSSSTAPTTTTAPPAADPAPDAARLCADATGGPTGTVENPDLVETSGLARANGRDDRLWAHNDSGDSARIFGLGTDGSNGGEWSLARTIMLDSEDLAVGPGPIAGESYVHLADIGDNFHLRPWTQVYRFVEPTNWGEDGVIDDVESFSLTYPDGRHDAESFLVDPISGDWIVITKEVETGISLVFHAPAPTTGDVELTQIATIDLNDAGGLATAADFSPDGAVIGVRTYAEILLYARPFGGSLADAFAAAPCVAPSIEEPGGGEAFAFLSDTAYATVSEGAHPEVNVLAVPDS